MSPPLTKDKKTKIPLDKVNSNQEDSCYLFQCLLEIPTDFSGF